MSIMQRQIVAVGIFAAAGTRTALHVHTISQVQEYAVADCPLGRNRGRGLGRGSAPNRHRRRSCHGHRSGSEKIPSAQRVLPVVLLKREQLRLLIPSLPGLPLLHSLCPFFSRGHFPVETVSRIPCHKPSPSAM